MQACFFTPVHSLPLHDSPAWHHLLELVFLCGGLSPLARFGQSPGLQSILSVLSTNSPALAGKVEWSGTECVAAAIGGQ